MEFGYVSQFLFFLDADDELFDDAGQFLVEAVVGSRDVVDAVAEDPVSAAGNAQNAMVSYFQFGLVWIRKFFSDSGAEATIPISSRSH